MPCYRVRIDIEIRRPVGGLTVRRWPIVVAADQSEAARRAKSIFEQDGEVSVASVYLLHDVRNHK